jgi:uncharacterized protein YciI
MRKLIFLAAVAAFAQRPWPPPGMQCPERTIVLIKIADQSKINQFYDEHVAYLVPLMKSGKIVSAGPTDDGNGVLVYNSTNWAEIEAMMKKEPFTREGITQVVSHAVWRACEAAK